MNIAYFHPRRKFYLTAGSIAFFLLIFVFIVLLPRFRSLSERVRDMQLARNERIALDRQMSSLHAFARKSEEFEGVFRDVQKTMVVEAGAPIEFVQFLENTAVQTGVQIEIVSVAPSAGKALGNALVFELKLSGLGSDVLRFLAKLEKTPYLIEVKRFQLEKLSMQSGTVSETGPAGWVSGRSFILVYAR